MEPNILLGIDKKRSVILVCDSYSTSDRATSFSHLSCQDKNNKLVYANLRQE